MGSDCFIAPEVLREEAYSFSADVWSLGILLYEMLFANVPYVKDEEILSPDEVNFDRLPGRKKLSDEVIDLLQCMLRKDPAQRLTLLQVLDHPWLQKRL